MCTLAMEPNARAAYPAFTVKGDMDTWSGPAAQILCLPDKMVAGAIDDEPESYSNKVAWYRSMLGSWWFLAMCRVYVASG